MALKRCIAPCAASVVEGRQLTTARVLAKAFFIPYHGSRHPLSWPPPLARTAPSARSSEAVDIAGAVHNQAALPPHDTAAMTPRWAQSLWNSVRGAVLLE